MSTSVLEYSVNDGVAHIEFNRPDKRNAINLDVANALLAALVAFRADQQARVAVISGQGEGFCAGGDITMFPSLDSETGLEFTRGLGADIHQAISGSRKPIVAAAHGFCLAGGFEIALACHMIFSVEGTQFAMKESRLGLIPGWGGTVRLARRVPTSLALDLLLSARALDATAAAVAGIVTRVYESHEGLMDATFSFARHVAALPNLTVELALDIVRAAQMAGDEAFAHEQKAVALLFGNQETQQRVQAVLNRGIGRE